MLLHLFQNKINGMLLGILSHHMQMLVEHREWLPRTGCCRTGVGILLHGIIRGHGSWGTIWMQSPVSSVHDFYAIQNQLTEPPAPAAILTHHCESVFSKSTEVKSQEKNQPGVELNLEPKLFTRLHIDTLWKISKDVIPPINRKLLSLMFKDSALCLLF